MTSKVCPTCTRTWGADFRFCPADGAELRDVAPEPVAAPVKAAVKPAPAKAATTPADRMRTAPTEVHMPLVKPGSPPPASPAEPAAAKGGKRQKPAFSETAWFMQKIDPSMVDPETGRVLADTTKGNVDAVDPETRRKYSLRKDNEE